jgi:biopolymer transport protein ExbD
MAGAASEDEEGGIYTINVTPLVDITLVLLIIMMVTAKVIVSQGMPMEVPKATKTLDQLPQMLSVAMTADGKTKVDEKDIANEQALLKMARDAKRSKDDIRAVIRAEKKVHHGRVIRVLDLLKQAGIQKVAFAPPTNGAGAAPGAAPAPAPAPGK